MHRLLRDPFLHFSLLGVALFVLYALYARVGGPQTPDNEIVVSVAQQRQLTAAFERAWGRAPTAAEARGLVDDWVREELANREATAMGLDTNDLVVRRRLRQKYEAFMEQFTASAEPTESDLADWHRTHADRYREDARFSLQQLFFSSDRREDAEGDARRALTALAAADASADVDETMVGSDPLAIERALHDTRRMELSSRFGQEFTTALEALPAHGWQGPVRSAYGYHLVYIESYTQARIPPLDEVRYAVLRDWRENQVQDGLERLYAALLERYSVTLAPDDTTSSPAMR